MRVGPSHRTGLHRRAALLGAAALAGCRRSDETAQAAAYPVSAAPGAPLRDLASFPVGSCISTAELDDPAYVGLTLGQVSQVIPSWQFQMDAVLPAGGGYDLAAADRIAAFARANGLSLHGHALVWYAQGPAALKALDGQPRRFAAFVCDHVGVMMRRYRGLAASWDVVNEPVAEDGSGLRACLFSRNLGQEDYVAEAFAWAHAADPSAVLVLNEFDLERTPAKRRTFMRLVERLLKRGAPVQALGAQSHLDLGTDPALIRPALRELATLGLPIRVSELDVSFDRAPPFLSLAQKLDRQARLYAEVAGGFMELAPRQRLAFAVWGLDDARSWRRFQPGGGLHDDRPCPFDDAARPKPAYFALAAALRQPV